MSDMTGKITSFYRGRSLFITGGTGFIGKVLIEKLLRSCPDIGDIYVLMRPKRGKTIQSRIDELLASECFDHIKVNNPTALKKIVPVAGDVMEPNLGLSPEDSLIMQENVSIVFHVAATVKFDEPLKKAAQMNIVGTIQVAELCHKLKKLDSVIHVSTAYANCDRKESHEVIYPPPVEPKKLLDWLEWMDSDLVDEITPKLLGKRPNTYTFTKAIAETAFKETICGLPSAIIRPSIVTGGWKEPLVGWIDNLNGPGGMCGAVGKGLVRTLFMPKDMLIADFIPVDIVVNLMIAVAWRVFDVRPSNPLIFNCTSSTKNPTSWKDMEKTIQTLKISKPFEEVLWYPCGETTMSLFIYYFKVTMYHTIPAYLLDLGAKILGKEPKFVSLNWKVLKSLELLRFFYCHEWRLHSENTTALLEGLSPKDREIFNFDVREINWMEYLENYYIGIKKFIFKETGKRPSNIRKMYCIKKFTELITYAIFFRILLIWTPAFKRLLYSLLGLPLQTARMLGWN